jgi:hypothetical protein
MVVNRLLQALVVPTGFPVVSKKQAETPMQIIAFPPPCPPTNTPDQNNPDQALIKAL